MDPVDLGNFVAPGTHELRELRSGIFSMSQILRWIRITMRSPQEQMQGVIFNNQGSIFHFHDSGRKSKKQYWTVVSGNSQWWHKFTGHLPRGCLYNALQGASKDLAFLASLENLLVSKICRGLLTSLANAKETTWTRHYSFKLQEVLLPTEIDSEGATFHFPASKKRKLAVRL